MRYKNVISVHGMHHFVFERWFVGSCECNTMGPKKLRSFWYYKRCFLYCLLMYNMADGISKQRENHSAWIDICSRFAEGVCALPQFMKGFRAITQKVNTLLPTLSLK
jgi:hypothetical protein